MTTLHPFEYVVLRVVPRVDRGESINAGVVLYCQALDYLGCRVHLDRNRLAAPTRARTQSPSTVR